MIYIEKKKLSRSQLDFIETELLSANEDGIIDMDQLELMLNKYEPRFKFDRIESIKLLGIGILLLSIIAAVIFNWGILWRPIRISILVLLPVAFFTIYVYIKRSLNKDLRYFLYIGVALTTLGIIACETLFYLHDLNGLQWAAASIALIIISLISKDRLVYLTAAVLSVMYSFFSVSSGDLPYLGLVIVPVLILLEKRFTRDFAMTIINNTAIASVIVCSLFFLKVPTALIALLVAFAGVMSYSFPLARNLRAERLSGVVLSGLSGLALVYENTWKAMGLTSYTNIIIIIVLLLLILAMIYMMKEERLGAWIFLGIFGFRLYSETLDKILPKEILFIIIGALLIYLSLKFEKRTRLNREKFKDE